MSTVQAGVEAVKAGNQVVVEQGILVTIAVVSIIGVTVGIVAMFRILNTFLKGLLVEFKAINSNIADQNDNMKTALNGITTSLNIIQSQIEDNADVFAKHDARAEEMQKTLIDMNATVRNCNKK